MNDELDELNVEYEKDQLRRTLEEALTLSKTDFYQESEKEVQKPVTVKPAKVEKADPANTDELKSALGDYFTEIKANDQKETIKKALPEINKLNSIYSRTIDDYDPQVALNKMAELVKSNDESKRAVEDPTNPLHGYTKATGKPGINKDNVKSVLHEWFTEELKANPPKEPEKTFYEKYKNGEINNEELELPKPTL